MMNTLERAPAAAIPGGDRKMVDFAELAGLHTSVSHPLAIADVFGDGVMLSRLPPLARLRARVTNLDYRFVPVETLPQIYDVLPLLLLPEILAKRHIPYRRNAEALLDLVNRVTSPIIDEITFGDISPLCLVHHESSHALFFETVRASDPSLAVAPPPGTAAARRLVEVLVESEGFALGFDLFCGILARVDERPSTNQLASINSPPTPFANYEKDHPGMLPRLGRLALEHPAAVLELLCTGAFIANLRPLASNQVAPRLAARLSELACVPAGFADEARHLLSMGLSIDQAFRQRVAPTLFRYLGIEREFRDVVATPLDEALSPGGSFLTHLRQVAVMVLQD